MNISYELIWQRILLELQNRRASKAITIGLVILIVITLCNFLWDFLPSHTSKRPLLVTHVAQLPNISQWHLLGDYAVVDPNLLPISQLNLVLEGIFYSEDSVQSQAVIAAPNLPAKVYSVGQEIMEGAVIKQILRTSVILEQDGQLQNLPLKVPELQFAPLPTDTFNQGQNN